MFWNTLCSPDENRVGKSHNLLNCRTVQKAMGEMRLFARDLAHRGGFDTVRRTSLVIALSLLTLQVAVPSASGSESVTARLGELARAYHEYRAFEGAILVADQGNVVYRNAFGWANREWEILNTPDTRFLIASVTKPITAALTVLLVQQKEIDLDAPIWTYLPDYRPDTGSS